MAFDIEGGLLLRQTNDPLQSKWDINRKMYTLLKKNSIHILNEYLRVVKSQKVVSSGIVKGPL